MAGPIVDNSTARLRTPVGINLAAGAAVMIAAAVAAGALFPDRPARLVILAVAVGGYAAAVGDVAAAVGTAVLGYLLFTGFLVHRYGELGWDGTTSLWRLAVFVIALGVGLGLRWLRVARAHAAGTGASPDPISTTKESHGA